MGKSKTRNTKTMIPPNKKAIEQILKDKNIKNDLERAKDIEVFFEEVKEKN